MKEVIDYIVKNKYVLICIAIVLVLYALGIVQFLAKFIVLLALLLIAIYIGKKLQDNNGNIKKILDIFDFKGFKNEDSNVYYYQDKKEDTSKK